MAPSSARRSHRFGALNLLLAGLRNKPTGSCRMKVRRWFRPQLEILEDRIVPNGTWQNLTASGAAPPDGGAAMMLLSDGSVLIQDGLNKLINNTNVQSPNFFILSPHANTGTYVNGAWSNAGAMNEPRLDFPTAMLPDGRVFAVGGEYPKDSDTAEIYDPVANKWTYVDPFPQSKFADDPIEVISTGPYKGQILAGYLFDGTTYRFNPSAAAGSQWTQTAGSKLLNDRSDEEAWVKLQDGSILSYDIYASASANVFHAQRYDPTTDTWVDASDVSATNPPSVLTGYNQSYELGPGLLQPDGNVIYFGANGNTAIYNPTTNTWSAGFSEPTVTIGGNPTYLVGTDDPGAVLPNGHILIALAPEGSVDSSGIYNYPAPAYIYEYDPTATTAAAAWTDVPTPGLSSINAFQLNMVVLPSGQVLLSNENGNPFQIYTEDPATGPQNAWQPTITSIADNGNGIYTLTGTQLNGIDEGANYGDDNESASNYPLIRFTDSSGNIYYGRTVNWSSMGVATGSTPETVQFTLPAGKSLSNLSTVSVIANGIASAAIPLTGTNGWTALGPAPILNGEVPGKGAVSGRITGIAADPKSADIVYLAAASGGIWKTTNATAANPTWTPLTDNLKDANGNPIPLFMGAIAETDATSGNYNGNQIVYGGTGEANNNYDGFYGSGILVSTDGGNTWTLTTGPSNAFAGVTVSKIVIDPSDPTGGTAYAAVSGNGIDGHNGQTGIWKTTDFGKDWANTTAASPNNLSTTDPWSDVVIDPHTPSTLYAAEGNQFGASGNGVYISINGGTNWKLLSIGANGSQEGRIALALYDDGTTNELLVSIAQPISSSPTSAQLFEMLKITNPNNTTPTIQTLNAPNYMGAIQNGTNYGHGWYDTTLAVDPTDPNYIYAGGSDNGGDAGNIENFTGGIGTNWQPITQDASGNGPHSDDHAVAFDANGNLLDGNDGGIFRLNNPTNASTQTWTDLNTNLQITQFYGIAVVPGSSGGLVVFGGSQDNGTEKYTGQPGWNLVVDGDGGITRVDPSNSNRIYQERDQLSLQISTDGGNTFSPITTGYQAKTEDFYVPYALDASGNLYYGTDYLNLGTPTAQGVSWSQPIGVPNSKNFNPSDAPIDDVAVNPVANSNVVYVSAGGNLFVTSNAQARGSNVTWAQISLPVTLPTGFGYSGQARNIIAIDPSDPTGGTAYVVVNNFSTSKNGGGHVFKITNFGAAASDVTDISVNLPNVPVWSVVVSPDGKTVYVGTDVGVYSTSNGGTSWAPFGTGLPNAQVYDLQYVASQNLLVVATHGRGVWEISTVAPQVVVTNPGNQSSNEGQNIAPLAIQAVDASSFSATGLPSGLSINSTTGVISGTIGAYASGNYSVTVTGSNGTLSSSVSFTWTVADTTPPSFTNPGPQTNTAGDTVNVATKPVDADAGSITATGLPSGLSIDPTSGVISGTIGLNAAGSYTVTVSASDGTHMGSTSFTWTVNAASSAPVITTQPTSQTVNAGQNATFTAAASGNPTPTVQWQVSTNGGSSFTPISGATSTTLRLTNITASMNGYQYEAIFSNSVGSSTTTAATLTVQYTPTVTINPTSQTVNAGQNVTFTAAANGNPTPTVQWQVSTDGKTFTNISGATSTTLTLTNTTAAMNGYEYQAVFSNSVNNATSTAATLTVQYAPTVTTNPSNETVIAGQTATFTAAADANPAATVQWQVSSDSGKTWSNLGGETSPTLTLTNVTAAMNGNEYQAIFTNSIGANTTSVATLTVQYAPTVTANPGNLTVIEGRTATFTASVNGNPAPTAQWQVSSDGGKTWINIANSTTGTSSTLTLTNVTADLNDNEYQAVFTNGIGTPATSTAAVLTVQYAPTVTTNPSDDTMVAGQTATFTASVNSDPAPTAQWQVSSDGGKTWINIANSTTGTSSTLTLTNVTADRNGNEYQAVFTNSIGAITTSAATLTVQYAPTVTANPSNRTLIAGQTATFTASAGGNPPPTVQWEVSNDGGATFTPLFGATSPTLTLSNTSFAQNGYEYRAVFTNSVNFAVSSAAILTVHTVPVFTSGSGATFTDSVGGNFAVTTTAFPTASLSLAGVLPSGVNFTDNGNGSGTLQGNPNFGTQGTYYFTITAYNVTGIDTRQNFELIVNPFPVPALNVPSLLALFDSLLGGVQTVNPNNGTETITDSLFGITLLTANFDHTGHLVSVSLFGIDVTFLFGY